MAGLQLHTITKLQVWPGPHPFGYEGIFLALRILFSLLVDSPVAAANHSLINERDSEISS
jgi:hypothetical protein